MLSNMGKTDRLIRTAVAFVIVFASIYIGGLWAIVGVVILLTTIIGWCPIYALFRLSTTKEKEEIPPDTSGEHELRRGPRRSLK
jgi:Inner membrane protein YgaP-like, transmembrane domain